MKPFALPLAALLLASLAGGAEATELDANAQAKLGLRVATLTAGQAPSVTRAVADVLDPAPLAKRLDELKAAQAAVDASQAEVARTQALLAANGNASRKALEAARAQAIADQARLRAARVALRTEWGDSLAQMDARRRDRLVDTLVDGSQVLLKAEPLEHAEGSLQVRGATLRLPQGADVTAQVQGQGKPVRGVLLPRAAIVRWNGLDWAYVATGPAQFERRAVVARAMTPSGWLVGPPFRPGERVVVQGAEALIAVDAAPAPGSAHDESDD